MSFESFMADIQQLLPAERIISDEFRCFVYGVDASCIGLKPKAVLQIHSEFELSAVLRLASSHQTPLTFRGAGSSVSGQATGNSVLIQLTSAWTKHQVEPLGERIHLQAGVSIAQAKRLLAPYGRQLILRSEPIDTATIGGLIADGVITAQGARLLLADGSVIDSRSADSITDFRCSHAELLAQLADLRTDILADAGLTDEILQSIEPCLYAGYNLRSFLDYEDPLEILFQLIAGSEGTLGFVAEAALPTIEKVPYQAGVIAGFETMRQCFDGIASLQSLGLQSADILDTSVIGSSNPPPGLPLFIHELDENGCFVFLEVRAESQLEMQAKVEQLGLCLNSSNGTKYSDFYSDTESLAQFYALKASLSSFFLSNRLPGSTSVYQGFILPYDQIENVYRQVQWLLTEHGYTGALLRASAVSGEVSFVFCPVLQSSESAARFLEFKAQIDDLVGSAGGCLSSEFGVGRLNGRALKSCVSSEAYATIQKIKAILDPDGILNPGVICCAEDVPLAGLLKETPVVHEFIDACTDCGICESVCVGKGLNFTARQRIAAYREIERRKAQKQQLARSWEDQFKRLALDNCVATGLCQQVCPMDINVGQLVLQVRAKQNYKYQRLAWSYARHFAALSSWFRICLQLLNWLQRLLGAERLERFSKFLARISKHRIPVILSTMPGRARPVYARNELIDLAKENTVVYWPSCITQSFGKSIDDDRENIPVVVQRVLKKANLNVVYPQPTRGLCCGQTLAQKGFEAASEHMLEELIGALWDISSAGRYPVLADTSACSLRVKKRALERGIHLYDSSEFIDKFLLNRLKLIPEEQKIAVHITCATRTLNAEASFYRVLNRIARHWVEPEGIECCGFSYEMGFMNPDLSEQSLKALPEELKGCVYGVSNSRTCEIGLSRYSGITYYSLFELLDRHSEAAFEAGK
jgi:D-lactate dehydrogenase